MNRNDNIQWEIFWKRGALEQRCTESMKDSCEKVYC